jgi:hypothetical protein
MLMDKFDEIEDSLRGQDWKGDPEKALGEVGGADLKKIRRKAKIRYVALYCLLCAVLMTGTGLITWFQATRLTKTGTGMSDNALSYTASVGQHYYPAAIAQISDSQGVYADFYYAFDNEKANYIVVDLHLDVASRISLDNAKDGNFFISDFELEYFGLPSLIYSFSTSITLKTGIVLTFSEKSYDMTPYFNSVMKK